MLRSLGPRRDGGAGLAEYAGLIVLAALILGALVAIGIPSKVETGVSSAICRIFQENNCAKPQAAGKTPGNQRPGPQSPGGRPTNGQTNGGPNNASPNPNGKQPSLADLQKKADDAQKAANNTSGKYGNIKQEIIDLLKDFIGITDIEDCISKGSISSCLWAAFDVASWVFAALKIAKFAKAVKDAIKLWKEFNKGRKLIDKAKDAARRAREALKKRRRQLGCPTAFSIPRGSPSGRAVYASVGESETIHFTLAGAWAEPPEPDEDGCINWSWKSVKTFGHTFSRHGAGAKNTKKLLGRAAKTGEQQGQWLDNEAAAKFLRNVHESGSGATKVRLPDGLGQVIMPDGSIRSARYVTISRFPNGLIRTAYPTLD